VGAGHHVAADECAANIKSKQIEALRRMGLPFHVNAVGKPVVTAAAIEGRKQAEPPKPTWQIPK
jgi:hypothetical protein